MPMLTLGVIADTHVPDRRRSLHPSVLPTFRRAGAAAILHAGDLCAGRVVDWLEEVAPVHAVRGNRDIFLNRRLPLTQILTYGRVTVGLTHGHGGFWRYLRNRSRYVVLGAQMLSYFHRQALQTFPQADVVVFGHTHYALNRRVGGQLLFNPGSACISNPPHLPLTVGLLHIEPETGQVAGEIVPLG